MYRRAVNTTRYSVPIQGFSHSVAVPPGSYMLVVSGLTARGEDGTVVGVGDPATQMAQVFENLSNVLRAAGATLDHVVSIRTFVTDIEMWSDIEPSWGDHWGDVWPASTLVQVERLFDERQMIEMEATAVIPEGEFDSGSGVREG